MISRREVIAIRDALRFVRRRHGCSRLQLNYSSVNLPFALGYTYDHSFGQHEGWTFDPAIFGPPFFAGTGFAGVKYLRSPLNSEGQEVGLTLFGSSINGGSFRDASNLPTAIPLPLRHPGPISGRQPVQHRRPQSDPYLLHQ